ncbi:hypothetical protein E2C01_032455 [Portunus trituberculatus]|uniref:Uncharacterized protein n=1 Tax=Portunus trituberculatus TaxID=210409 RepID=A0A5B7F0B0_PORTR|nr:hypothetical protein [Portunus trituberculatus]
MSSPPLSVMGAFITSFSLLCPERHQRSEVTTSSATTAAYGEQTGVQHRTFTSVQHRWSGLTEESQQQQ